MKFSVTNPSMLDMRDAILLADLADPDSYGESLWLIWGIFAKRGMGWSATIIDHNDENPTEVFDLPPDRCRRFGWNISLYAKSIRRGDRGKDAHLKWDSHRGHHYKDNAGNISSIYSDGITLDTTKPLLTGVSAAPDPFKPGLGEVSTISFTASDNLSGTCTIRTKIYNASNTLVRTVTKSRVSCPAGGAAGFITWDGKNGSGVLVPAGTYTYKLQAQDKALNWSAIRSGTTAME